MRPPDRSAAGRALSFLDTVAQMVAGTVLVAVAGLLLWSTAPVALGWTSSAVVSGSMTPQLRIGDVVVTSPVDGADVVPGQVVLFPDPSGAHRTIVHRVASVDEQGRLVTRGDANGSADSTPLPRSAVEGLGRLRVPFVGLPRVWWETHDVLPLIALGVLLLGAGAVLAVPRPDEDDEHDAPGGTEWSAHVHHRDLALTAVVGAAALVLPLTATPDAEARFTGITTTTGSRSFTAGTVSLTTSPAAALFSVSGMIPGDTGEACLTATYTGSLGATVRLRAAPGSSGSLAPYLQTTVQEGTGSTAADCTGFSATSTIFTGRLNTFLGQTSYATGVGSWTPSAAGQTHVYRVTFQLRGANAARSTRADFALVVEAQNT